MELRGTVVLVTGAGSGIGAALTRTLTARGASVVALDIDAGAVTAVAEATGATPFVADVRDPAHAEKVVAFAEETHGRLDVVVANAGIGYAGAFVDMPVTAILDLLDVNVRGPLLLARAALPGMLDRGGGAVAFVTSIAGALPITGEAVYSATKAAVEAFSQPLREELRGSGVTVTTVLPVVVATEFFARRGAAYDRHFPRPVTPERLADAIVRAVERGETERVVPGWVRLPIRVRGVAPRFYRAMARRFGG